MPIFSQSIPKKLKMQESFQTYSTRPTSPCYQIDKDTKKENYISIHKKGKLQINMMDEHGYKSLQENITKSNSIMHQRDHTLRSSRVCPRMQESFNMHKSIHMIQIINK